MTKKNSIFNLSGPTTLTLKDLYAKVIVRAGQTGKASIEIDGDEKLIKLINVSQPNSGEVLIEGRDMGGGDVTVIQSRGSSISVRGSGVVIGGDIVGGRIVSGNNLVIVNGKVVSGGGNVTEIEGGEIPTITVTMPEQTELDAESVEELDSQGLKGKLYLSLDGQNRAKVQDADGVKINCSGQTRANVTNAKGDLKVSCSGQSRVIARGNFDDVDMDSSEQSQINVSGNCRDCEGSASGQSTVTFSGHPSGKIRKHESGMSCVEID
jgi:hypothetical protein